MLFLAKAESIPQRSIQPPPRSRCWAVDGDEKGASALLTRQGSGAGGSRDGWRSDLDPNVDAAACWPCGPNELPDLFVL